MTYKANAVSAVGDETISGAKTFSDPIRSTGVLSRFGNGGDPNAGTTQYVCLLASTNRVNPDKIIEQHFVGYSFYSGTPDPAVGTLQGGSSEAYVYANGSADWPTALGFEGVGRGDGNAGRTIATVIGNQGTALANGNVTVNLLVGIRARGPQSGGGTPTVGESRSIDLQQPVIGTIRRTLFGIGAHHFRKGDAANIIEISNSSGTLRWANEGDLWKGFASNGTSVRLTLDTQDTPTAGRLNSQLFGSGKHVSLSNSGAEVASVAANGLVSTVASFLSDAAAAGVVLKDTASPAHYWRVTISTAGALTTTDLGTTKPTS